MKRYSAFGLAVDLNRRCRFYGCLIFLGNIAAGSDLNQATIASLFALNAL